MADNTQQPTEQKGDAQMPKTYTQEEVDAMLAKGKEQATAEVRKEAVTAMATKQAELKGELLKEGQDDFYNLSRWEVMRKMADDMVKSGALPKSDNMYTIMMKMQAGREMGMKPIEALKSFYIVNGVLNIFGSAVVRRLREHGWSIRYEDAENKCTATITKGDESYTDSLTFDEATKSGWTGNGTKPGWLAGINRKLKLRYGVTSMLIKTYVPDVLGSAVDIAEVAEDTVPLFAQKSNGNGTAAAVTVSEHDDEPATDEQLKTVKVLAEKAGVEVPEGMTFGQAKAFILDHAKNGKK